MANVIAVIGSNYGDEGKGIVTDFLSHKYKNDAVVIRSNGSSQAGHTVVTPEGQRHAFSHFGSGTFNGSPTFLSKFFVINPLLFMKEHKYFVDKFNIKPKIFVDSRCIITNPYDMLLNQRFENLRDNNIHGSCGIGFGETIERQLVYSSELIGDYASSYNFDKDWFNTKIEIDLEQIRDEYIPSRINLNEKLKSIINSHKLINDYIEAVRYTLDNITIKSPIGFKENTLIFEGAQGLLLDMDYGFFPHVTRSNCGMKNISQILKEIPGKHNVTVNYVTRAYTTRHGAGPLDFEDIKIKHNYNIVDETNIPNKFQGVLRLAPFNYTLFNSVTTKDFLNYAPRDAKKVYTITCLDQLNKTGLDIIRNNKINYILYKEFIKKMVPKIFKYQSYGPTRTDITLTNKS